MQPNTECLLLLIHPDSSTPEWLPTWARSYPHSLQIALPSHNLHDTWQHLPSDQPVFIVAHRCPELLDWYYHADILSRRRIIGIILQDPPIHNTTHQLWQQLRFDCPTAILLPAQSQPDTAIKHLPLNKHTRLITPPAPPKGNWQWGMKLMQEMMMANPSTFR